jgi:hypothetical protein
LRIGNKWERKRRRRVVECEKRNERKKLEIGR